MVPPPAIPAPPSVPPEAAPALAANSYGTPSISPLASLSLHVPTSPLVVSSDASQSKTNFLSWSFLARGFFGPWEGPAAAATVEAPRYLARIMSSSAEVGGTADAPIEPSTSGVLREEPSLMPSAGAAYDDGPVGANPRGPVGGPPAADDARGEETYCERGPVGG
jgi:hypothetical protein